MGKDVCTKRGLQKFGFGNFLNLGTLLENGLPQNRDFLSSCGVYVIVTPSTYEVKFLSLSETSRLRNVICPWKQEDLKLKWVKNTEVVYFGCAGTKTARPLRRRVNDLLKHGNGRTTDRGPHRGGEIIWQLKHYNIFEIGFLPTGIPREQELALLGRFHDLKGKLPFANRQF